MVAPSDSTVACRPVARGGTADDSQPAPLPEQPLFAEVPDAPGDPPRAASNLALGRPSSLHAAAPEGFWIWFSPRSSVWHLRATTQNHAHHFQGRIRTKSGALRDALPTRDEFADRVRLSPNAVSFDFLTQGGIDGLDISSSARCLHFNLLVDNNPHPARIFIGSRSVNPPHGNFLLCR